MAELADAPDLGSGGRPCRFDSCHPHILESLDDESSRLFLLGERLVNALYLLDLIVLGKIRCLVIWAGWTGKVYF